MNFRIFKNISVFCYIVILVYLKYAKATEGNITCPYAVLRKAPTDPDTAIFDFKYETEHELKGSSVELFFDQEVDNLQVNLTKDPIVYAFSKKHWIISMLNTSHIGSLLSFSGNYTDLQNAKVTGVILNGQNRLCGQGTSKVFVPESLKYDGHRVCTPTLQSWEHDTRYKIVENFHSGVLGLIIDVIFDANVEKITEASKAVFKRVNKRRFTFINHGFITEKGKPVVLEFGLKHFNKPPPKVAAICINNVIICGFAPSIKAVVYDVPTPISSTSALLSELSVTSPESILWALIAISTGGVVVAMVMGVQAWKIASRDHGILDSEPIYAMPTRD